MLTSTTFPSCTEDKIARPWLECPTFVWLHPFLGSNTWRLRYWAWMQIATSNFASIATFPLFIVSIWWKEFSELVLRVLQLWNPEEHYGERDPLSIDPFLNETLKNSGNHSYVYGLQHVKAFFRCHGQLYSKSKWKIAAENEKINKACLDRLNKKTEDFSKLPPCNPGSTGFCSYNPPLQTQAEVPLETIEINDEEMRKSF